MSTFKVICKNDKDNWVKDPVPTKTVVKKYLFGLITSTKIVADNAKANGPSKDEICIVYETYNSNERSYYRLKGYGEAGYITTAFVRLDEFTETQKEIAEKSNPVLN
mgnify:FL=1|jgi:hypothetical protein